MRERDLRRARDDLAAFARAVGWPLATWQARALALAARTTYVIGPRQSGKSRSVAVLAAHRAFREAGHQVLIVSASELGAKRLLATVAELVVSSPLLSASVVDEQASLIRLTNGSTIRSVPASEKAIRGWSIDTLVLDEATELTDAIIDAALPTTAARPDARIVFLSTGGAPVGRAYETFMAGMGGGSALVRSFVWRLKDAKWVTRAAVELARLTMPPWRFAAEYEGQWAGAVDALFPPDLLARASGDFELPALSEVSGPARLLGGVDWGATHDRTAVACIARLAAPAAEQPVFVCWVARHFDVGTELAACVDEIARSAARWSILSYETNGLGMGPSQLLRARMRERGDREAGVLVAAGRSWHDARRPIQNPTNTTWQRKADVLGQLRLLAERGQLYFARQPEFMRQLAAMRVEHRQHSVAIEAAAAGHDDCVDAAYLATASYTRTGQLRCRLAELARMNLPGAELPPHADDAATLDNGLPRTPWLQPVGGAELTPPRGTPKRIAPHEQELSRIREQIAQLRKEQ